MKWQKNGGIFFIEVPNCGNPTVFAGSTNRNSHLFYFTSFHLEKILLNCGYKILKIGCFRAATKRELLISKLMKNYFPYYPRIETDQTNGRDLRVIVSNN